MRDDLTGSDILEGLEVQQKTILSTVETSGAMSIVVSLSLAGSNPTRRIHMHEDETFVVLSG